MLQAWPVGVDYTTIPPDTSATAATKSAAVYNICRSASAQVNGYVTFPLRSVINVEYLDGPDYRATVQNSTGVGRLIMQRWPVTQIVGVSVSPAAAFPRQWTALPSGSWDIEVPILGSYGSNTPSSSGEGGQAVLIAPGYLNWCNGRWGTRVQVTYIHGWPHSEITANVDSGAGSLTVGDITGFGPASGSTVGAEATVYDVTGGQESVKVTAATPTSGTTQAGPGTLTLAASLTYAHAAGILISALPSHALWATALFAGADALTRGATATQLRSATGGGGPPTGAEELKNEAEVLLHSFRRTI
jgi:hypothetical protein